jgi:simple sugar transport system permease protein
MLFAATGEIIGERSGVINLGIEGVMELAALAAVLGTLLVGVEFGFSLAILVGVLMGLLVAYLTITLEADQVVAGLAVWLFGLGIAFYLWKAFGVSRIEHGIDRIVVPQLSQIPILGKVLFSQDPLIYVCLLIMVLSWVLLFKTRFGLEIRATGHRPEVSRAAGLSPWHIRYVCVILGSVLMAIGGAYLTLVITKYYAGFATLIGIVAFRGFAAMVFVFFSSWHPLKAGAVCFFVGSVDALQLRLQGVPIFGIVIPTFGLAVLPYLVAFFFLALSVKRGEIPEALGKAFTR